MKKKKKLFEKIFDKEIDNIFRYIFLKVDSREIAEDLTQSVFLRLWEKLEDVENPKSFLYKLASDAVVDFYRKKNRDFVLGLHEYLPKDEKVNIEEEILKNIQLEEIKNAIGFLKDDYQNVIIWHYLNGLSIQEIAQLLNRTPEATRVLLHRGLTRLKEILLSLERKEE